ncbi:MAG: Peptidoglycan endopeptidase LytF [Chlamydiae bacterium]|nr:Peptidoglycan endopeptidase LytF [Chlamydiota bacterium]
MSRRDTIIIAVLVNSALLMVLFATAIRSPKEGSLEKKTQIAQNETKRNSPSEEMVNQLIASVPTLAESMPNKNLIEEKIHVTPSAPVALEKTPKAPQKKEESKVEFVQVTVKNGDFLEKIARANQTTVAAIMKANHMTSTQLKIGQVLKVPLSQGSSSFQISSPQEAEYYIVQDGDNPWLIANRNHLKLDELLKLNELDEQRARRLRPGDRLRIR